MTIPARIRSKVERHLGPDADDDLFAKAMTFICEGFPPDCSHAATCLHDGDCFAGEPSVAAARLIDGLARKHDGATQSYLFAAATAIRNGKISIRTADVLPFGEPS